MSCVLTKHIANIRNVFEIKKFFTTFFEIVPLIYANELNIYPLLLFISIIILIFVTTNHC